MIKLIKFIKHLVFIRNPVVICKIFSGYFNTLVLKKDILRSIELAITYRCQAKCHKCYAGNLFDPKRKELTLHQIEEIIVQACRLGLIHVNITGGEPPLHNDLFKIIKICSSKKIMVSVVTNGMLLTENKVRKMKEAGLNTIQISLDSADRQTHDSLRGMPGCYDRIMEAIEWVKRYRINLCFSTVLSPESTGNPEAMKKLLELSEDKKAFLLICDSAAVGGWKGKREKMFLCEERDAILQELMKHPNARHHNMYNFRLKAGCPAGIEKIYITAYGDVAPCDLIHEPFGNVLKEPLEVVWKRMCSDFRFKMKTTHCLRYLDEEGKYTYFSNIYKNGA